MTAPVRTLASIPRAHRGDPASSHVAGRSAAYHFAASQCAEVLDLVRAQPGLTGAEYAERSSLDVYQVRRRLTDLKEEGRVYQEGMRKCRVGGRMSVCWHPSAEQGALL